MIHQPAKTEAPLLSGKERKKTWVSLGSATLKKALLRRMDISFADSWSKAETTVLYLEQHVNCQWIDLDSSCQKIQVT